MAGVGICLIGGGRIGSVHAASISRHPGAQLRTVVDISAEAAETISRRYGARPTNDLGAALSDSSIDAVVIASATGSHPEHIEAAARAGEAIFCEKPIGLELSEVDACLAAVARAGVMLQVGFNRRFDPSFRELQSAVQAGEVGRVELVAITSRDPEPPPIDYIRQSGGLFRDMTIHDFDTARWLLGEEPVEVYATGSNLVDDAIGEAGDVDTAMVILRTQSGALCHINNSRRAVYGYDQRIEVFGSRGMLRAENRTATSVERSDARAVTRDQPLRFFIERYAEAYEAEMAHFIDCVATGASPLVGGEDGRRALLIADAAQKSSSTGQPVRLPG